MRTFHCDRCDELIAFTAHACPSCEVPLGYVCADHSVRSLRTTRDPAVFEVQAGGTPLWRCLNAAWGCNWMLPAAGDDVWCRACRLTRGRPDESNPAAVQAWITAEAVKRRLVHQLDELALRIEIRSTATPDGLAFDLVYLPGTGGITGHTEGVVTLDLCETDAVRRDELRRRLGEPFRTVIGHLRHEIGHHYWNRLVAQTDAMDVFRQLFGDERADYTAAIANYYATGGGVWDPSRHVTAYAAAHPLEDWAETFAHYLHIIDATDTAAAHHLVPAERAAGLVSQQVVRQDFGTILEAWRPINAAVNAVAETLGAPFIYPYEPAGAVIDKLAFVHRQVAAHTERDNFYAVS
jgi:hypothetical protein